MEFNRRPVELRTISAVLPEASRNGASSPGRQIDADPTASQKLGLLQTAVSNWLSPSQTFDRHPPAGPDSNVRLVRAFATRDAAWRSAKAECTPLSIYG